MRSSLALATKRERSGEQAEGAVELSPMRALTSSGYTDLTVHQSNFSPRPHPLRHLVVSSDARSRLLDRQADRIPRWDSKMGIRLADESELYVPF